MGIIQDNNGIAYAMVYIMMVLIMVGGVWVSMGIVVDEYDILTDDLTTNNPNIWTSATRDAITDLSNIWGLVLWITLICGIMYGLVSAIKKERGGVFND